jgi:benzoyl-CoA reductase/2-hydroxyglutaryl-CoA dehydratase subunit BcrC/BadD/HgdB
VDYSDPYPADSEQLYKQTDKLQERVDSMLHNEVGIKALEKAVDKLQSDVEKLKDKQREFGNGNSH